MLIMVWGKQKIARLELPTLWTRGNEAAKVTSKLQPTLRYYGFHFLHWFSSVTTLLLELF